MLYYFFAEIVYLTILITKICSVLTLIWFMLIIVDCIVQGSLRSLIKQNDNLLGILLTGISLLFNFAFDVFYEDGATGWSRLIVRTELIRGIFFSLWQFIIINSFWALAN